MMSTECIRSMSDEAAREAAVEGLEPIALWPSDCIPPFNFPNIGSMEPEGFEVVEALFVDSSGLSGPDEPALTAEQFSDKLMGMMLKSKAQLYAAITEIGQFQLYVTVYQKEQA